MKKVTILLFFLLATSAFAQKKPWDKFDFMLQLKLDMKKHQVDSILTANHSIITIQKLEQKDKNQPENWIIKIPYNGFESKIALTFLKDSLREILVNFEGKNLNQTNQEFAEIKTAFQGRFNGCQNDKATIVECFFGDKNQYSAIIKLSYLHSKTTIVAIFKNL